MDRKNCLDCDIKFSIKMFYRLDGTKPYEKYITRCRDCRYYRRNHAHMFSALNKKNQKKLSYLNMTMREYNHMLVKCECGDITQRLYMYQHKKTKRHFKQLLRVENLQEFFKSCG